MLLTKTITSLDSLSLFKIFTIKGFIINVDKLTAVISISSLKCETSINYIFDLLVETQENEIENKLIIQEIKNNFFMVLLNYYFETFIIPF